MQIIEATLAFAITMLTLSMVASVFVEMIHRLFRLRERGLHYILGQLFDSVLAGYALGAGVPPEKAAIESLRKNFQERMTENRAPVGLKPSLSLSTQSSETPTKPRLQFGNIWGGRALTKLTVTEFMEKLGSDDIGDKIIAATTSSAALAVDTALRDIAQKFEAFGREASVYFEGRARFMSVVSAIIIAFALHVDAVELFQTFLRDPAVRASVIAKRDEALKTYEEKQNKIENTQAVPSPPDEQSKKEIESLKTQLRTEFKRAQETVTQLTDLGVPLGWTKSRIDNAKMEVMLCSVGPFFNINLKWGKDCNRAATPDLQIWIQYPTVPSLYFTLLLGGLLIGLGGPFWYDAVKALTNIRNIARSAEGPKQQETGDKSASSVASKEVAQPSTPVEIFKVSNAGRAINASNKIATRPHLNPDGTIA